MNTPIEVLRERLKGIDAQLKVCRSNNFNVEEVEKEWLHFVLAIKILDEFGFCEKAVQKIINNK